jgi:hypothetical protein
MTLQYFLQNAILLYTQFTIIRLYISSCADAFNFHITFFCGRHNENFLKMIHKIEMETFDLFFENHSTVDVESTVQTFD